MRPGVEVLPIDDAAHDAFMTLPPHTYRRSVEAIPFLTTFRDLAASNIVVAVSVRKIQREEVLQKKCLGEGR